MYTRLNQLNLCVSYPTTLRLIDELSHSHSVPLKKWLVDGVIIKFWGDNVNWQLKVQDLRSDNQGDMAHMFSLIVGRSRTPAPHLPHSGGSLSILDEPQDFFPSSSDISAVKENLIHIISRLLTTYITGLSHIGKVTPKHILHEYSREMAQKSEVYVLDVMMKNEAKHSDMIDIMRELQGYLGGEYDGERRVACGGDQLTCERQVGSQVVGMCRLSIRASGWLYLSQ